VLPQVYSDTEAEGGISYPKVSQPTDHKQQQQQDITWEWGMLPEVGFSFSYSCKVIFRGSF